MRTYSKIGFTLAAGLSLVITQARAADLTDVERAESAQIAKTVPIADLHDHDGYALTNGKAAGVNWAGLGAKRGGRESWLPLKQKHGDKFMAWAGQREFNRSFFQGGIEAMLNPEWPLLVQLYDEVEADLKAGIIVGVGEIFINNQRSNPSQRMRRKGQVDAPGIRKYFNLVAKYNGFLSFHMESDRDSMDELGRLLASNSRGRVLWNHCGSKSSAGEVRALMEAHPNVFCEISVGYPPVGKNPSRQIFNASGISSDWRQLMEDHDERFMVGTDAHSDDQFVGSIETVRAGLLPNLSPGTARKVAYQNAQRLFGFNVDPAYEKNQRERARKLRQANLNGAWSGVRECQGIESKNFQADVRDGKFTVNLGGAIKEQFSAVISPDGQVRVSGTYVDEGKTEKIAYAGRLPFTLDPSGKRSAVLKGLDGSAGCQVTLTSR